MKKLLILSILIVIPLMQGCQKQSDNPTVDQYISDLISGEYQSYYLPEFTADDIPALLEYRNKTTLITHYPHNPISSLWMPECKLGMIVLWTVESIRAVENQSEYLIMRFPSQNPVLALRDAPELQLIDDDESHKEAAKAYDNWWSSSLSAAAKMKKDPLEKTKYRWH